MIRYQISSILFGIVWGIYYAITRVYYIKNFGNDITLILALECLAMFLSLIFVRFLKYYKILVVIISTIPLLLVLIPFIYNKYLYVIILFLVSISYAIAYPMIVKVLNDFYPRFLVLATIGYSIGSILMGLISEVHGYGLNFMLMGLLLFISYSSLLKSYRYSNENVSSINISSKILSLIFIVALSSVAIEIVYAYSSYKLYEIVDNDLLYGILYGGISSVLLLSLRKYVDKIYANENPKKYATGILILYTIYLILLATMSGIIFIMLWQIPIYPFYEAAILSFIIHIIRNKEFSSSIILAGYGLAGGIFMMIHNFFNPSSITITLLVLLLMIISTLFIVIMKSRRVSSNVTIFSHLKPYPFEIHYKKKFLGRHRI